MHRAMTSVEVKGLSFVVSDMVAQVMAGWLDRFMRTDAFSVSFKTESGGPVVLRDVLTTAEIEYGGQTVRLGLSEIGDLADKLRAG